MIPGKLNLLSRWPGDGLGGVVALEGLDEVRKGAGDEGVEDVVEDGLLLESRFMAGGCSCKTRGAGMSKVRAPLSAAPAGASCHAPSISTVEARRSLGIHSEAPRGSGKGFLPIFLVAVPPSPQAHLKPA